jgi:hypothetical protein
MRKIKHAIYKHITIFPVVVAMGYAVYIYLNERGIVHFPLLHDSEGLDKMLDAYVTFASIILGIFGFLFPVLINQKGKETAFDYFRKNANMDLLKKEIEATVRDGLVSLVMTCTLYVRDIYETAVKNILITLWIAVALAFVIRSYRYIGIIIDIILSEVKNPCEKRTNNPSSSDIDYIKNEMESIGESDK